MGDWQRILFERRLLTWSSILSFAGLGLWLAALSSPHWLVAVPRPTLEENSSTALPSPLLSPPQIGESGRGLIWSHSGLYSLHSLVEDDQGLWWENEMWTVARVPALHSSLIMAGFSIILGAAAIAFSAYSVSKPFLMARRLAAVLHLLVAACAVTVLQLVDSANHSSSLHPPSPSHQLHYGYSVLLAWAAVLVSLSVSLTFCCASKRRKLLRNDNVTFRNQRLVISEYEKS